MANEKMKVYSKPSCVQCTATYRHLGTKGIDYEIFDLSTTEMADTLEMFKADGLMGAPVVVAPDGERWTGFRPDKINAYA